MRDGRLLWLGALKTGDSLIDVQKLWQSVPGSKTFVETEHCFPAFDTDIRKIAFDLEEVAAPAARGRRFKSFRMCEELMTELSVLCYRGTQDDEQ